jgi:hypothetical protein
LQRQVARQGKAKQGNGKRMDYWKS